MRKDSNPVVRLKPSSYQPSKAELEEEVHIDVTLQELLHAVVRDVCCSAPKFDTMDGVGPWGRTVSGGGFDRGAGLFLFVAVGAQVAERRV